MNDAIPAYSFFPANNIILCRTIFSISSSAFFTILYGATSSGCAFNPSSTPFRHAARSSVLICTNDTPARIAAAKS